LHQTEGSDRTVIRRDRREGTHTDSALPTGAARGRQAQPRAIGDLDAASRCLLAAQLDELWESGWTETSSICAS
jgi:hypothetical protein